MGSILGRMGGFSEKKMALDSETLKELEKMAQDFPPPKWGQKETEVLERFANRVPLAMLAKMLTKVSPSNKWDPEQIRSKLRRMRRRRELEL